MLVDERVFTFGEGAVKRAFRPQSAPCLLVGVGCRFYLVLLGFWAVCGLS